MPRPAVLALTKTVWKAARPARGRQEGGDMAARKTANGKATVAHFDEIPSQPQPDTGAEWKPVRHFFDLGSFGASLYVGHADGEVLTSQHSETDEAGTRHEELFYVAHGRATFVVDGEEVDAPAGTFVYVRDPDVRRGAVARRARHGGLRGRRRARRGLRGLALGTRGVRAAGRVRRRG